MKIRYLVLVVMLAIAFIFSTMSALMTLDSEIKKLGNEVKQLSKELKKNDFDPAKISIEAKKAVVVVAGGTGFLFIKKNLIVTNFHVIKSLPPDEKVKILPNDGVHLLISGNIKMVNPKLDLAVIELDEPIDAEPLMPADIKSLAVGEGVLVIGNPDGTKSSLSTGVISGLAVKRSLLPTTPLIQIDATLDYGSSGSPVINKNGKVIGIISNSMPNLTFSFAVPIDRVEQLISEGGGAP